MSLSESDRGSVFFKHFLRPFQALSIVIGPAPIQVKRIVFMVSIRDCCPQISRNFEEVSAAKLFVLLWLLHPFGEIANITKGGMLSDLASSVSLIYLPS